MFHIDASQLDHRQLNEQIPHHSGELLITGYLGQRFIGAGAGCLFERCLHRGPRKCAGRRWRYDE